MISLSFLFVFYALARSPNQIVFVVYMCMCIF